MESTVRFLLTLGRLPGWLRSFLAFLVRHVLGDPVSADTILLVGKKSSAEICHFTYRRDTFREEFNDWYQKEGFDALIAPTSAIPATKFNGTSLISALAAMTLLYNMLDWPVGVIPVTKVKEGEVISDARWKGKEKEGYSWMLLDQVYGRGKVYDATMKDGVGLPVGVQVQLGLRPH